MRLLLPIVALTLAFVAGASQAQDAPGVVTYYLHQTGTCANGGFELFSDQNDSSGDLDGCGAIGAGGAAGGFAVEFPGKGALKNASVDASSTAKAFVYVETQTPGPVSVEVGVAAGAASCTGASPEKTLTNTPVTVDFGLFEVSCTFKGVALPKTVPTVSLLIHSQTNYYLGFEGDHASRVEIHGAPAASPASSMPATPTSPGKSPGVALPLVLAAIAAVAVLATRRRA